MPSPIPAARSCTYTPVKTISGVVARCRDGARKQLLLPVEKRKEALRALLRMLQENEKALQDAVHADVGKHPNETQMLEISCMYMEIVFLLDHLDEWVREKKAPVEGMNALLLNCTIRYDPLGCVLVIGAWNYPIIVLLNAVAGALAAGNTVVMKPSEVAPATAQLVADLVPRYLSPEVAAVVNGGVAETTELLQRQVFDHIFYTGNGTVGKIVMAAAAKNLTPVALELGGKSPVIVDETCRKSIDVVAARLVWGKYTNAGQTCIGPDYLLIHESLREAFVAAFRAKLRACSGASASILEDPCFGRIVNARHYDRVVKLLEPACGKVVVGGETDAASLKIGVTLMDEVNLESPLMQDEIFGPLLPMITFHDKTEAISFVNARPKPLALYVFSQDTQYVQRVKAQTSSGGVVVNDVMLHVAIDGIPFGGVGPSGMGAYHGWASFETFSHRKGILNETLGMERPKSVRYAPYTSSSLKSYRAALEPWGEKSALRRAAERVASPAKISSPLCFVAGVTAMYAYLKYTARIV